MSKRQRIILQLAAIATVIVLLSIPAIGNAFFSLLFLGAVPFTSWQLPPWVMMLAFIGLLALTVVWLSGTPGFLPPAPAKAASPKRAATTRRKPTGNKKK